MKKTITIEKKKKRKPIKFELFNDKVEDDNKKKTPPLAL